MVDKIEIIEDDLQELKERFKSLSAQYQTLERVMNQVLAKVDAHIGDEKRFEATLHSIDESIKDITLQLAQSPMERHKEVKELIDPMWQIIRKHDSRFSECGDNIKNELRKEAKSHLTVLWFGMALLLALAGYVYKQDKNYISSRLDTFSKILSTHTISDTKKGHTH